MLHHGLQSCLVFAARYSHHRRTGASFMIINTIKLYWGNLSKTTQDQILSESGEATTNLEDWKSLREYVREYESASLVEKTQLNSKINKN